MAKVKAREPSEALVEARAWTWTKTRVQQLLFQVCAAWPVSTMRPGGAEAAGTEDEEEPEDVFGFGDMGLDGSSGEEGPLRGPPAAVRRWRATATT